MSKFEIVREKETEGPNEGITNDDIIAKLEEWDSAYSVEVDEVGGDRLTVRFGELPVDLADLSQEIYKLCPDIIGQHFGCMDELVEMMEETGQELEPELADLVDGVDLEAEDFGMQLLRKSLASTKSVSLWWD